MEMGAYASTDSLPLFREVPLALDLRLRGDDGVWIVTPAKAGAQGQELCRLQNGFRVKPGMTKVGMGYPG